MEKITRYIKLSKAFLSVALSLALLLPPGLVRAETSSAGSAPGVSKDSIRIAKYFEVIQGYLEELKLHCDNAHPAVREYIASIARNIPQPPQEAAKLMGAREKLDKSIQTAEDKFTAALAECDRIWKQRWYSGAVTEGDLAFEGTPDELGFVNPGRPSHVFVVEKDLDSPYPRPRDLEAKAATGTYLEALKAKHNAIVAAVKAYLQAVEAYYQKELKCPAGKEAPKALFESAKQGAGYCWGLSLFIPAYRVNYYQQKYQRDNDFYPVYEEYFRRLAKLYSERYASILRWKRGREIIYHWRVSKCNMDIRSFGEFEFKEQERNTTWENGNTETKDTQDDRDRSGDGVAHDTNFFVSEKPVMDISVRLGNILPELPYRIDFDQEGVQSIESMHSPLARDGFRRAVAAENNKEVLFCQEKITLLRETVAKLNAVLPKYQQALPCHSLYSLELKKNFYPFNIGQYYINFNLPPNQNPYLVNGEVDLGKDYIAKTPEEKGDYELKPPQGSIKDPEGDRLNYRWVITSIPETENAKSQLYCFYQKLSDKEIAKFKPDLAGDWEFALQVNDGSLSFEDEETGWPVEYVWVRLQAKRHILWIQHSNGPYDPATGLGISLELYQPIKGVTKPLGIEWGGPYYLEVSHEKVGVYQNYNDDGMPVDEDSAYAPQGRGYCFETRIIKNSANGPRWNFGDYDGFFGSSNLKDGTIPGTNPEVFHRTPEPLKFRSASGRDLQAVIKVKTIDPQITDLRLSTEDCRGEKIHYSYTSTQGVLEGEYEIKQWVNHFTWLNRAGKGFSSEKVDPADLQLGKEYQTPDWMERRVAEVINLFPEALPYVERIFVEKDEKLAGHYELETKLIWIRPNMLSIRYNYPYKNGYGFYTERGLDGTARHEAYHAFEWHRVRDKDHNKDRLFPDNDPIKAIIVGDDLPGVSGGPISGAGGEKFQYIYDSAENKFGPVEKDAISPGYPTGYEYKGDNIWDRGYGDDYPTGSIKRFVEKIDFSSAMLDGEQIVIILPSDIPTSNNFSEQLYFEVRRGRKKYEALELVKDKHYRISMLNQKTVSPWLCLELINRAEWETLFKQEKIKIEDTKSLYLKYETCIPLFHKHPREYDASRIEPAEYVGQWSGGD